MTHERTNSHNHDYSIPLQMETNKKKMAKLNIYKANDATNL